MGVVVDRIARHTTVEAPVWRVWSAIVEPAQLCQWTVFESAEMDAQAGGTLTIRVPGAGVFRGVVEDADAPHRLAYRLSTIPDELPHVGTSTRTLFTLTAEGDSTQVHVEESGFAELEADMEEAAELAAHNDEGWHSTLAELKRFVEERPAH
jgi:uncharacterized protein YndB with AHSA1/START domain